jgi:hypothetical protein
LLLCPFLAALLPCQRDFNRADVGGLTAFFAWSCCQLLCADIYAFYLYVWQESAPDYFDYVNCSAYGSSSGFNVYFIRIPMEESYAGQHIVHCRLSPNQNSVAFTHL